MKNVFSSYLERKGINHEPFRSGMRFHVGGRVFYLWLDASDHDFLRLTTPAILNVTNDSYARVIMAANTINAKCKVSKVVVYDIDDADADTAWVCFEQIVSPDNCTEVLFERIIKMMITAAEEFETMATDC